jgi:hypothetical protein
MIDMTLSNIMNVGLLSVMNTKDKAAGGPIGSEGE